MIPDDTNIKAANMPNANSLILIVDDEPDNLHVLSNLLRHKYRVKAAISSKKALEIAQEYPQPDLILLDVVMPEIDGYTLCRYLKKMPSTKNIPIIFVTTKGSVEDEQVGLEAGAVDYITKPISPPIVQARIQTHLFIANQNRLLEHKVSERTRELEQTRLQIIRRLGRAAEFKDNETGFHVIRMSYYSRLMAEAITKNPMWSNLIFQAAPMHDIGKIGIPDHILLKTGKLTNDEWQIMQKHPQFGASILGDDDGSDLLHLAKEIALGHHEKWDGTGYPNQLKGKEIPLSARIVAIADVFDALTTARPYKDAWSVVDAVEYIEKNAGKHFDPALVKVFKEQLPAMLRIRTTYSEEKGRARLSA
ncbi:HD domain-containing phosphohydrolase [Litoribrevibacter euphylliae]|uniref:HD domain-containing phosphohydrolase n=1 Tax=Litoribrevibacter euphylliae TaxID=1834034 RepID=A0ABV7HH13_9GAMM